MPPGLLRYTVFGFPVLCYGILPDAVTTSSWLVDVIDLYQIHWPIPDADVEEGWSEVAKLIEAGKIRYGGVSNFSVDQIERCQAIHPVASLQPLYSMLDRETEAGLLAFCAENQIGVVAYSPMASGLLTGKYTRQRIEALPAQDWRKARGGHFQEPELSALT